ncbi:MAG: phosphotransferase family protein, partial [Actinobacteria bacterium]|nr:phosphotransferase family protein [Actinomycetota bacterium]
REVLPAQLGAALAQVHAVDTTGLSSLPTADQVRQYREALDQMGQPHPAFELAFKWLEVNRPAVGAPVLVHGDFRLGNVIVGDDGLRAVIDWELAHLGDPMEDLGWLCVKAWRFGSSLPVAGVGEYRQLFEAYEAAGGGAVDPDVVRWWEVLGTLKWGVMCIMQANAHVAGLTRSHELAAIGRRVCENEHDLFLALEGRW